MHVSMIKMYSKMKYSAASTLLSEYNWFQKTVNIELCTKTRVSYYLYICPTIIEIDLTSSF